MPYIIYKANGKILASIPDGSINTSATPLTFVGKNYAGYGQILDQNLSYLLENFSNNTPPNNPVIGQLWYDNVNQLLQVYNGSSYKSLASFSYGITQPLTGITGDLWFNTYQQQLYIYNGSTYLLVGPQTSQFAGTSIVASESTDINQNQHYSLNFTISDANGPKIVAVASKDEFNLTPTDPLYNSNYTLIKQGITLPTSDPTNGNSISNSNEGAYYFWGTAATSRALVYATSAGQPAQVHYAEEFLLTESLANSIGAASIGQGPGLTILFQQGVTIGSAKEFWIHTTGAVGGYISQLSNQQGSQIDFQVQYNYTSTTVLSVNGAALVPGFDNTGNVSNPGVDLGANNNIFQNLYVNTVTTNYSSVGVSTATTATINGSLYGNAGIFYGLTVTNYFNALNGNISNLNSGITTATSLNVTGNTVISGNSTINGNLVVAVNGTFGSLTVNGPINVPSNQNITGNVVGNLTGSIVTATNAFFTQVNAKGITVSGALDLPFGSSLYANFIGAHDLANGTSTNASGYIQGQWHLTTGSTLQATYADIAERYHADAYYEYGTVLVIGGSNEVTTTDQRAATSIAGIVSKNPAYTLNAEAGPDQTHPYVALKGRVPCKVVGVVHKSDRLVTSTRPGYAETFQQGDSEGAVLGIALEDNLQDSGMIEIKV
jgi:hypothetical protein